MAVDSAMKKIQAPIGLPLAPVRASCRGSSRSRPSEYSIRTAPLEPATELANWEQITVNVKIHASELPQLLSARVVHGAELAAKARLPAPGPKPVAAAKLAK